MRIAFFGLPLAALLLLEDGHQVVYAGICREEALGFRRLRRRLPGRWELRPDLSREGTVNRLRDLAPDLLVSWFWTKRIPGAVLSIPKWGGVGVHPSLLPRHRGPDPYFWAIDSGDDETGVTAHRLDDEYDTGAVYGEHRLRIDPAWSAWTLAKKLDRPSLALLREVVARFATGGAPAAVAQNHRAATLAPLPKEEDLAIVWTWPAEKIARRVRASSPWPGAWTTISDTTVILTEVERVSTFPRALAPGEAAVVSTREGKRVVVRAGDGAILLRRGRLEANESEGEDDEKELVADDFVTLLKPASL